MKKFAIFAMSEKGYEVLKALFTGYPDLIDMVISSRDEKVAKDYFIEIERFCKERKIPIFERMSAPAVRTEYAIAVSWRWMIKNGAFRLIVLHDSLLPGYRGFNPLVTALINGDAEIGVTAVYGAEEYDRGDIICSSKSRIFYPIKVQDAIKTIIKNYTELVLKIAGYFERDIDPPAEPQQEKDATYSLWRDEEDYFIDWSSTAPAIQRFIDAVGFPYKGAATKADGRILRVLQAEAINDLKIENRNPGKVIQVLDSKPVVVCGAGLLKINEIVDDKTGRSILPLRNFRTRFRGISGHRI